MSESKREELGKLARDAKEGFKELTSVEAKLLLLGELNCQKLLREYGMGVKIYREGAIIQRLVELEEMDKYREDLLERRNAFFSELSDVYKRI